MVEKWFQVGTGLWEGKSNGLPPCPAHSIRGLDAFDGAFLHPGHHGTKAGADFFDVVGLALFQQRVVLFVAGLVFFDPALREGSILNFLESLFHALLNARVDDFRTDCYIAPFRCFADGETHAGDASFVHQIDNQFQFVEAFEVGHLGLVTGFDEDFVSGLHQRGGAAAEDGLFAEKIGFGFFLEGGFDDAGAGAADAFGPGELRVKLIVMS